MRDVISEIIDQPAKRRLVMVALVVLAAFAYDFSGTRFDQTLAPVIGLGDGIEESFLSRLVIAILLGVLVWLNSAFLSRMPFRVQVVIVWAELLFLFLAFFYSFNLSFPFIIDRLPILIFTGAFTTIYVSLISIAISCVIAMAGAIARLSSNGPAYATATFYTSFFRGTPLLLQVYLIYLGLPQLGFVLDAVPSGIIALSLCYGAYMAEIFRAGIQSIPHGQWEASRALGFRPSYIMRLVILPQAIRVIIPPTGNQFIAMLKDSSLVSVMGVWELMFLARTQGRSEFKHFEMLITAAVIYWIISFTFEMIQARIEYHYGRPHRR